VSAEQILENLREGKDVDLKGRIIDGNLDADQAWPPVDERRMNLRVIRGNLRLDSCRISGRFAFRRCIFIRDLELPCSEIRGDLDLTDSDLRQLNGSHLHIVGSAHLAGVSVGGDLSLPSAQVGDRLDLTGARVRGALRLGSGEFRNDLDLVKATLGGVDLSFTRVTGQGKLQDVLILSDLTAHDAVVGGGLLLDSVRVLGQANLNDAEAPGGFSFTNLVAGSDLMLALASDGPVALADVDVGGDLSLFDGRFASMTMERLRIKGESEFEGARFSGRFVIRDSDFGRGFTAQDALFQGDCEFRKVRFPGKDPMAGALFTRSPLLIETSLPVPPTVQSDQDSTEEEELEFQDSPMEP